MLHRGSAGSKRSEKQQREHQGQKKERDEDEVLCGAADIHAAACGEDHGRAGGYFLKELGPMEKSLPWSRGKV